MDHGHGFSLASPRQEEFWRLIEMEQEEPGEEHAESHGTHGINEVPPPIIIRVIPAQEPPSNERSNQLTNRPPDRKEGQVTTRSIRQELQEQRAVHRKITTNTNPKCSIKPTCTNPRRRRPDRDTEDASQEQRHVERETATQDIRADTPETCSYAKTDEK